MTPEQILQLIANPQAAQQLALQLAQILPPPDMTQPLPQMGQQPQQPAPQAQSQQQTTAPLTPAQPQAGPYAGLSPQDLAMRILAQQGGASGVR